MRLLHAVVICLFIPASVVLAEPSTPGHAEFPGLKTLVIEGGDSATPEQIGYLPALANLINKPVPRADAKDPESEQTRLVSTRLSDDSETRYLIDFDPGPSADPMFVIIDEKSGTRLGVIGADKLLVPGNGFLYASGRSNEMHLVHRKFAIREGKLVEIKQPFSYVGLDSKARRPLTLKSAKNGGETVAHLPTGTPLQVVLRDDDCLLIKTRFGLLGWWKMDTGVTADTAEIEGIYYAGD